MLNFLLARLLPLIQILRLFLLRFCFNFDSCFDSNRIPAAFYFLASVPVTYYVFVLTLSYTNPTSVSASNCFYSFHVSFPKLLMFLLLNVFQFLFCSYIHTSTPEVGYFLFLSTVSGDVPVLGAHL